MDGYTKAAIKEAMANRTPRQVKRDDFLNQMVNGPALYSVACLFYGFWGWVIYNGFFN